MQDAGGEILIRRMLVRTDLPYRTLHVDLAGDRAPAGAAASGGVASDVMRPDQLAALAGSLAGQGLVLQGDGSTLGRSGLRRALRHVRALFPGWIALETRGPEPADLEALLSARLVDFLDVQLSWMDVDPESDAPCIRTTRRAHRLVEILCRSACAAVLRFISPAQGEIFNRLSPAFDAFVRNSPEAVAVRVFEASERLRTSDAVEPLEFVACRSATVLVDADSEWLSLQGCRTAGASASAWGGDRLSGTMQD